METLAFLTLKKEFTDSQSEVELTKIKDEFMVRLKYNSMKTSKIYVYKSEEKARYEFTKLCLFILS